jgi:hypothetical protein
MCVRACSRGASQDGAEDAEDSQSQSPWPPGAAEALQTRLSSKHSWPKQLQQHGSHDLSPMSDHGTR